MLKAPVKFYMFILVSAAQPVPDYCHLKGDQGCNSAQSVLDQERPFKPDPSVAISRV